MTMGKASDHLQSNIISTPFFLLHVVVQKKLPGRTLPAEDTVFKFNLASHGREEFTMWLFKEKEERNRLQTRRRDSAVISGFLACKEIK